MKPQFHIVDNRVENEIVISEDCDVIVENSYAKLYNDTDKPIHVCYKNSFIVAAVPENTKYQLDITQYSIKMTGHIFIIPKSRDYYIPQTIMNRVVI